MRCLQTQVNIRPHKPDGFGAPGRITSDPHVHASAHTNVFVLAWLAMAKNTTAVFNKL